MPIPSQSERITFWKFAYARASFVLVQLFCKQLLGRPQDVIRHALSIASMVTYARPFKQRPAVKLSADIVPAEFKEAHNDVIEYRDKVIAHRDLDGPVVPWGIVSELIVDSDGRGFNLHTVSPMLTDDKARVLIDLTQALIEKAEHEVDRFVRQYFRGVPPIGAYTVSLEENPSSWLVWASSSESQVPPTQ